MKQVESMLNQSSSQIIQEPSIPCIRFLTAWSPCSPNLLCRNTGNHQWHQIEVNRLSSKRLLLHLKRWVFFHLLLVFISYFSHSLHYLLQTRLFLCESVKVAHGLFSSLSCISKMHGMLVNPKASTLCSFPESVTLWLRYFNLNLYNGDYEERNAV